MAREQSDQTACGNCKPSNWAGGGESGQCCGLRATWQTTEPQKSWQSLCFPVCFFKVLQGRDKYPRTNEASTGPRLNDSLTQCHGPPGGWTALSLRAWIESREHRELQSSDLSLILNTRDMRCSAAAGWRAQALFYTRTLWHSRKVQAFIYNIFIFLFFYHSGYFESYFSSRCLHN